MTGTKHNEATEGIDMERAREDADKFNDYLVTFEVEQWWQGNCILEEQITLRLAGTGLSTAVDGAKYELKQVFSNVEAVRARNDHTDENIDPPFIKYEDPFTED